MTNERREEISKYTGGFKPEVTGNEMEKITECLTEFCSTLKSRTPGFTDTFVDSLFAVIEADYLYGDNDIRLSMDKIYSQNDLFYSIMSECYWNNRICMEQPAKGANENMLLLFRAIHDAYLITELRIGGNVCGFSLAIPSSKKVIEAVGCRACVCTHKYLTWQETYSEFMSQMYRNIDGRRVEKRNTGVFKQFLDVLNEAGIAKSALSVMSLPRESVRDAGLKASSYCSGENSVEDIIELNTDLILKYADKGMRNKLRTDLNAVYLQNTAKECIHYDPSTYTLESSVTVRYCFNWGKSVDLYGLFKLALIVFSKVTPDIVRIYDNGIKQLREVIVDVE